MRIAIGELKQETNTFVPIPTTLRQFEDFHLWRGADVVANLRGTNTEVGGFLEVAAEAGWSVLPTLAGFAISGGPLDQASFGHLREDFLQRLDAARPFDAVLLALHGAMVAESEDDADGALLQAVRELIGPGVPLVVTMDLHGNLSERSVEAADAIVAFRTCPHVDQGDTGRRAAQLLAEWLAGGRRPAMARVKIPMVTPASTHVDFLDGPFRRLMAAARAAEQRGAAAASLFTVQPWLDVPDFGFAALVVTRADAPLAESLAAGLAEQVWSERHAFMETELVSPEEAIGRALARPDGPVVLSDLADGTGAGSPGDATAVLAALLEAEPNRPALVCVCDPAVAAEAARTGAGGRIDTLVGGKRDCVFNRPVRFAGTVDFSRPASYRFSGPAYTGIKMEMGLTAVLRRGNVRLLVTSNPVMTVDPALYRAGGLEPADAQIVVVKSHIQFRAGYAGLAKEIILLDSPGMSSDHLAALPFRRVRRPLFPLDCDFEWSARG